MKRRKLRRMLAWVLAVYVLISFMPVDTGFLAGMTSQVVHAAEAVETITTPGTGNGDPYTYMGNHFKIDVDDGGYTDLGFALSGDANEIRNATITALNGEIITSLELRWTRYTPEATSCSAGTRSIEGDIITFSNVNASSVTLSTSDYLTIDQVKIHFTASGAVMLQTAYNEINPWFAANGDALKAADETMWQYLTETLDVTASVLNGTLSMNENEMEATWSALDASYISAKEIVKEAARINVSGAVITMSANSAEVASVVVGGQTLTVGTDYTVSYQQGGAALDAAPTAVGSYTAVITGIGDYKGTEENPFVIKPVITDAVITMAENSAEVVSVVLSGTTLTAGTDYVVSYKQGDTMLDTAPTAAGKYTAVLTGIGDYYGTAEKAFTIRDAQSGYTDELTVYDGTTTNNYVPAYVFYFDCFTRCQYVIPETELSGIVGSEISELWYYVTNSSINYSTDAPVDVYLKEVSYTIISSYESKDECEIVYQGPLTFTSVNGSGMMKIVFDTPFIYNGGNLLIGLENTSKGSYTNILFYGQNVGGGAISNSNSSNLESVSPVSRNFIPKTTLVYIATHEAFDVTVEGGANASVSGITEQLDVTGMIQNIIYTAAPGYKFEVFPDSFEKGITVHRINREKVIVSGIPTGDALITVPDAVQMSPTVQFSYNLTDSYGDGWNDAAIYVYEDIINEEDRLYSFTINNGSSASGEFDLETGCTYMFLWKRGSYDSECSFEIYNDCGELIHEKTSGFQDEEEIARVMVRSGISIRNAVLNMVPDSSAITSVMLGEVELTEGTDYTVSYRQDNLELGAAPTDGGIYTVTIHGIGAYVGSIKREFIIRAALSDIDVAVNDKNGDVTVKVGSFVVPKSDYVVTFGKTQQTATSVFPTEAGTYYVFITAKPNARYVKGAVDLEFVTDGKVYYTCYLHDRGNNGWNGNKIEVYHVSDPEDEIVRTITLTSGGEASDYFELEKGQTYRFVWKGSEDDLECSFEIMDNRYTRINQYTDRFSNNEEIARITVGNKISISDAVVTMLPYTEQVASVKLGNTVLVEGQDYYVSHYLNENQEKLDYFPYVPGVYDVVLYGRGSYNGTISKSFRTNGRDITYMLSSSSEFDAWTKIDHDGDGYEWNYSISNSQLYTPNGGVFTSSSYISGEALEPDNWIISPAGTVRSIGSATASLWACGQDPDWALEPFAIYAQEVDKVSLTNFDPSEWRKLTATFTPNGRYQEFTADLSDFKGKAVYVAIRHFDVKDQFRLLIDDITLPFVEYDGNIAANVTYIINSLPATIKPSDREAVEAARAAYDAMTDNQKTFVSAQTLQKLTNAEAMFANETVITGASLTLMGDIGVNLYFKPAASLDDGAYVLVKGPNDETGVKYLLSSLPTGTDGAKKVTCLVYATQMGENITFELYDGNDVKLPWYDGNGNPHDGFTYSANNYINAVKDDSSKSAELRNLVNKMQNYGAWSRQYFGNKTAVIAAPIAVPDVNTSTLSGYAMTATENYAVTGLRLSLVLDSTISIRLHYTGDAETITVSDDAVFVTGYENGKNYVEIQNIAAQNLDQTYLVTFGEKGSVTVSALTYAYSILRTYSENENKTNICNTVRAMYLYNQAAKAYFASINQ